MSQHITPANLIFLLVATVVLHPAISSVTALLLGVIIANIPIPIYSEAKRSNAAQYILKFSVVGLGFGLELQSAIETGKSGFYISLISVLVTLGFGLLYSKYLNLDYTLTSLISSGTAICGGSAIATISPILDAKSRQISLAIGVVFILNAIALLLFPFLGNLFEMSSHQFGMWCAIAIHDTSSVIGAASVFGEEALKIATTVKLTRALWIIPLALMYTVLHSRQKLQLKIPWYIVGFILAIVLTEYVEWIGDLAPTVFLASKSFLKVALYLIGSSLTIQRIKEVGWKPMQFGITLWLFISILSFVAVQYFI